MNRVFLIVLVLCVIGTLSVYATGDSEVVQTRTAEAPAGQDPAKWSGPGEMPPTYMFGEGGYSHGPPSYGGTITFSLGQAEPPDPSVASGLWWSLPYLDYIQERAIIGDTETYGPRGTGESRFSTFSYIPQEITSGHLVESWELSPDKLVVHVRPGIMWAPTQDQMDRGVMSEPRELVADDFVFDWVQYVTSVWSKRFEAHIDLENASDVIYATDKYTAVIEIEKFSHILWLFFAYEDRSLVGPPETEAADPHKWENQIGTGPWQFEELVSGSHISYTRNDNYWRSTTIDGQEYQLPFIDRVRLPIMPDQSTHLAALRTGQLDLWRSTPSEFWNTLDNTDNMQVSEYQPGATSGVWLRTDKAPFDNADVRRALRIGTNNSEFQKLVRAEDLPLVNWPTNPDNPGVYTPLEELPANIQELWEYDPAKARRMLDEAGIPEGFSMEILLTPSPQGQDVAALLKDQWSKIGVDLQLNVQDNTTVVKLKYAAPEVQYEDALLDGMFVGNPYQWMQQVTFPNTGNYGMYNNPAVNRLADRASLATDPDEVNRLTREAAMIYDYETPMIPLYMQPSRIYWWPWVKNYFGESTIQDDGQWAALVYFMWLDEELKGSLGY